MRYNISNHFLALAVATLALGMTGCGSRQYDVAGTVTYNGVALNKPEGQIVFVGPGGEQVPAAINPDGTYRATGVMYGTNRVVVYYPNPAAKADKGHRLAHGEKPPPTHPPVPLYLTPANYAAPETSELSVQVDKETTYDVDLVGPPIKDPLPARPLK